MLVTDEKVSFVLFLYAEGEIQWSSADSSGGTNGVGGTSAQVGFNAGDGWSYFSLSLSQTDDVIDIDRLPGNTGVKGLWIFRVDQREINSGQCSNDGKRFRAMTSIISLLRKASNHTLPLFSFNAILRSQ